MTITIYGLPAPQGSKKLVGRDSHGRGILVESSAKVKPWRESVKWAAIESGGRVAGPVRVEMIFTLPKPKSAPKKRKTYPDRKPDIDKLCRSSLDALVFAGTIEDDARVIDCQSGKRYPNEGYGALDRPGAVIRIEAVRE